MSEEFGGKGLNFSRVRKLGLVRPMLYRNYTSGNLDNELLLSISVGVLC